MTNTTLLQSKISESGFKDLFLAKACGITERTFYNKKKSRTPFVQDEILVLRNLLKLTDEEIAAIFFAEAGDNPSTEGESNG